MKRILLFVSVITASFSFAQVTETFNFTGSLNANGWTTHSGTAGQMAAITTASDAGSNLSYPGLPASAGNRTSLIAGNGEDVNLAVSGLTGVGYYSFLLKVPSVTGINASGDYFTGFGSTAGASVAALAARTFIKPGATAGTFVLGIQNGTGTGASQTYTTTEYPAGTTIMVVVKYDITTTPNTAASLFVNPVPGAAEPAAAITNASGNVTISSLASIFLRQAGSAGSGTGTLEIDEIRAGSTWEAVTPSGCATASTLTITNCGPYTLNGTPYNTSGVYTQVLDDANAAGCDSTITLNLTVNEPTSGTLTVTNCGPYTLNGTTYNTSGIYVQNLTNAAGCDSTLTLDLSVVASITYYEDFDADGLGNADVSQTGCSQPADYVTNSDDCDDSTNTIGLAPTWYADLDSDGLGDAAASVTACTPPANHVANDDDCDDSDDTIGAVQTWYADVDNDGYGDAAVSVVGCTAPAGHVANDDDCNDADSTIYPGATEIANNGIDEDCNGSDFSTIGSPLAMYTFTGNDCSGSNFVLGVDAQPADMTFSDYATAGTDCAAGAGYFNYSNWNTTTTPDLTEYNEFTVTPDSCYALHLMRLTFVHRISASGDSAYVHIRSSLDNFAGDIYTTHITTPGSNINETVDLPAPFATITGPVTFRFYITEMAAATATYRQDNVTVTGFPATPLPAQTYYADADSDGFGDPANAVTDCTPPAGYVTDNTDCNDANDAEYPGAIWYQDLDNDDHGNPNVSLTQCTQPAGYISDNTDCDDSDNTIGGSITYYADADNDGFGDATTTQLACTPPAGYVANDDDCDDSDDAIGLPVNQYFPDADNDGFGAGTPVTACTQPAGYAANDDDCDDTDDMIGQATETFYADADSDGYGNAAAGILACSVPTGYVSDSTDCNDNDGDIHPNATDATGNGVDENCDGVDGNVGLGELNAASVNVFPNPGSAVVNITADGSWNGAVTVTILSVDGKQLQTATLAAENGIVSLSTAALRPSVYFIRVTDGVRSATVRWVKH